MTDQLDVQVHLAVADIRRQVDRLRQEAAAWTPREEVNNGPRQPQH